MAPCGFAMDMPLSFRTMSICLFSVPALLRPSIATPLTMEESPMSATVLRCSSPLIWSPLAMPTAVEIAVPACPTEKRSYGDSEGCGNPDMPPFCRSLLSSGSLPVSSLCG